MPWNPVNPIIDGMKVCIICNKNLLIENFHKQIRCKNGYRPECKKCHNEKHRIYYLKNKDKVLDRTRRYSKTEYRKKYCRDYQKIRLKKIREENASRPRPEYCECCFQKPNKIGVVWDHNHKTGIFRGWLCSRCNRVLGMCGESIEVLNNLIEYIKKNE